MAQVTTAMRGSIPSPGTSTCWGYSKKKKKKERKKEKKNIRELVPVTEMLTKVLEWKGIDTRVNFGASGM